MSLWREGLGGGGGSVPTHYSSNPTFLSDWTNSAPFQPTYPGGLGTCSFIKCQVFRRLTHDCTVEPLLTDTSIIRTSLYYGQLQLGSKDTTIHTIPTSLKTDTSIIWTLVSVPLVSVLKTSDCNLILQLFESLDNVPFVISNFTRWWPHHKLLSNLKVQGLTFASPLSLGSLFVEPLTVDTFLKLRGRLQNKRYGNARRVLSLNTSSVILSTFLG